MPMQKGTCATCGVEIGGLQHKNVKGVQAIKHDPMVALLSCGYKYHVDDKIRDLPPYFRHSCGL